MKEIDTFQPQQSKDKTPETEVNETEISDLPDKVFKIISIKMFTHIRRTMHKLRGNFNKDRENIRKHKFKEKGSNTTSN